MNSKTTDKDLEIDDYVDGRMQGDARSKFENRMRADPELKKQVETATQSVELLRSVLDPVKPSEQFENKVSEEIINITQSNPEMLPIKGRKGKAGGTLTKDDPDAKLFHDPDAKKEGIRLVILGLIAALFFIGGLAAIIATVFG